VKSEHAGLVLITERATILFTKPITERESYGGDMSQELCILKHFLLSREVEYRYYQNIKKIENLQKEYRTLYGQIDNLYQLFPEKESITPDEMKAYLAHSMPSARDRDFLEGLIDMSFETDVGEEITEVVMQQLAEKNIATKMVTALTPVLEGSKFEQIPKALEMGQEYTDLAGALTTDHVLMPCEDTLEELVADQQAQTGLSFPLKKLQEVLGDAEYGTSGLVFARPETGKTSMGLTLAAHWSWCMKDDPDYTILYLGVEEKITKVRFRYFQSILGVNKEAIHMKPTPARREAVKRGSDRCKFFGSVSTTRHIESLVKQYSPKIIFIDQTSKIYMPGQPDSEVQRLAKIFLWVRTFAKDNDLLAVNLMQAAATAENKQWLTQTDLHNSKTDVAGETDWALGIGKVGEPGMEYARFMSLCRNKNGAHVRFQSYFDFNKCRYYDGPPAQKQGAKKP
jgi:replicative DNA helicase